MENYIIALSQSDFVNLYGCLAVYFTYVVWGSVRSVFYDSVKLLVTPLGIKMGENPYGKKFEITDIRIVGIVLLPLTIMYAVTQYYLDHKGLVNYMYLSHVALKVGAMYMIHLMIVRYYRKHTMVSLFVMFILLFEALYVFALYGGVKIPKMWNSYTIGSEWEEIQSVKEKYNNGLNLSKEETLLYKEAKKDGVLSVEPWKPIYWFFNNYGYLQIIELFKLFAFSFFIKRQNYITDIINERLGLYAVHT